MQTQITVDHWQLCDNYTDSSARLTIHGPNLISAVEQNLPAILEYICSDVHGWMDVHLIEAYIVPAERNRLRGQLTYAELHLVSDWPAARYKASNRAGQRRRVIPIYASPDDLADITPLSYIKER